MRKVIIINIISLVFLILSPAFAAKSKITVPDMVRIGLYSDTSAVSSVSVSSKTGLLSGYLNDGKFVELMEYDDDSVLSISKDAYFIKKGNLTVEYNPSDKNLPEGEKFGPYHIRIGDEYDDIDHVNELISQYSKKGIDAYPVYTGEWQIWYGQFAEPSLAEKEITGTIDKKLGKGISEVVPYSAYNIKISDADGKIKMIYAVENSAFRICPVPKEGNEYMLSINGKQFRGELEFRRYQGSDMTVINVLPLEHYLYGVVPREMGASSPLEALKAQAVAARNYTMVNMGKHGSRGYDLCANVHCQAYSGYEWEQANSNKAVDQTAGKKATYDGKLISLYYYSSSGGVTEDVKNVWGSTYPYLVSVEDKYETPDTYNYTWETVYDSAKIKEMLKNWRRKSIDIGQITGIQIAETAPSGRVTKLVVFGTNGKAEFNIEDARTVFYLNSQMYRISTDADISIKSGADGGTVKAHPAGLKVITSSGVKSIGSGKQNTIKVKDASGKVKSRNVIPSQYKFTGKGWGHAVGMSQNGAKGMANAGFKYDKILQHYFPGIEIE